MVALVRQSFRLRSALICVVIAIFVWVSRNFVLDDGLIYARVIRNALTGNGMVFNSGDHVNVLTSPLFTYSLLTVSWILRGHVLLAEHVLFALALLGTCLVSEKLAPVSGLLVASTAYFYSTIGLETSLFLFLLLLTLFAYVQKKYEWLPFLATLLVLTRFEAGILVVVIGWQLWREDAWPRWTSFLPVAVVTVAYLVTNHHLYGSFLPHSAISKFGQARSGYWGKWPKAIFRARSWMFASGGIFRKTFWMAAIVMIGSIWGWKKIRRTRLSTVMLPFFFGLFLFLFLGNIPAYHWYFAPLFLIVAIYAASAVPENTFIWGCVLSCLLLAGIQNYFYLRPWGPVLDYVNAAQWINAHSSVDATVASAEIGNVGWVVQRRLIDILGLTTPKNADHIAHHDAVSWLAEDMPDFVIVHTPIGWDYEKVAIESPFYKKTSFTSGSVTILEKVSPHLLSPSALSSN